MNTSRKIRPLNRKVEHFRDTKLIIIAVEGKKTEKQYFQIFRKKKVQVIPLSSEDNKSAPEHVLDRLKKYQNDYELDDNDELWIMIDVDRWGDEKLSAIAQKATQRQFDLAVSNPCFEVWLFLHFDDLTTPVNSCKELKNMLKELLGGYNSSNIPINKFKGNVEEAVKRSKALDIDSTARWPSNTGTHVYRVVQNIISLD